VQLQDCRYEFHLSFNSFNDILISQRKYLRQKLILISASQRYPILSPCNIPLIKEYADMYERLDWRKSAKR
jgi:hypothetical protein